MAASKLLANSDRQADDGVFSRDLGKAIDRLQVRTGWLDRCMQAMTINTVPKALLWQKIRRLRRVSPSG